MTYKKWYEENHKKRAVILDKLKNNTAKEIREYFIFENMVKNEPDFCPLYKEKKKCHDVKYLNCFYCACVHFVFNDGGLEENEGIIIKSKCSISSKHSGKFIYENALHCDCSNCTIPHTEKFVLKNIKKLEIIKRILHVQNT